MDYVESDKIPVAGVFDLGSYYRVQSSVLENMSINVCPRCGHALDDHNRNRRCCVSCLKTHGSCM